MSKILLVEDDFELAKCIEQWLKGRNYLVDHVETGNDGIYRGTTCHYDLVILDLWLPDIDGLEVMQKIKQKSKSLPVLLLTGRNGIKDITTGLDLGAEDYLTKPFSLKELEWRVIAILRRNYLGERPGNAGQDSGALSHDSVLSTISVYGTPLDLTKLEYSVLARLMKTPDQYVSAKQLMREIWHDAAAEDTASVRSCIKKLRKHLELAGLTDKIKSSRELGYMLSSSDS